MRDRLKDDPDYLIGTHEKRIAELEKKHNALTELSQTDGRLLAEYHQRIKELEQKIDSLKKWSGKQGNLNIKIIDKQEKIEAGIKEFFVRQTKESLSKTWINFYQYLLEKLEGEPTTDQLLIRNLQAQLSERSHEIGILKGQIQKDRAEFLSDLEGPLTIKQIIYRWEARKTEDSR